jgi:hypothetical protein
VPLSPIVVNTLREHRLASGGEFTFGTTKGTVDGYRNIVQRGFRPAQIKAGVVTKGGRPSTPGSMRSVISTSRGASTGWWMAGSNSR